MRYLLTAVLYTALATTANADIAALEGLRRRYAQTSISQ